MRRSLASLGMWVYALTILAPLAWVLLTSLKKGSELFTNPWGFPARPQWVNYAHAWNEAGIGRYFLNSVVATAGTLALLLPVGAMAAYVLAKYPFRGSKFIENMFLGGMMFPTFLVIVPLFFLLRGLNLLDTLTGLVVVYVAYSLSFTIFVLSGFFHALPDELAEAATLDGCGHSSVFWRVMFPLARPGLIVVGIFNAIGLWNEFNLALVLLPSEAHFTLPIGLQNLVMTQHYESDWGALFAGLVIVMTPMLGVYVAFRNRIHQAMLAGAIK